MLTGGCYCGAVRYEVERPTYHETNCHCSICRRTSGAPYVAWFTAAHGGFRWVRGEPTRFASTARAARSFCGICGTQMTFEHRDFPDEIDVTICSLDEPDQVTPANHIHVAGRPRWVRPGDGLPEHEDYGADRD
ncbi:MAG TPA: GFA family protein [Stellaceae bacterium]|nr:GFA family protein [Stellaceae bacterium]